MKVIPSLAAFLFGSLMAAPALVSAQDDAGLAPVAEPGTAEFNKHRPVYHFLARKNWMNDPCAPYYDEETQTYHMFYQSNPNQTVWGNMTWGHAVSKDQVALRM
uniref:Glycosyl hydrolase family 32 N-terminal domain-containing protein n=1 Tax=Globisporangium ultimum (strain ATCC 200006 / CBS 805.95 / DAOM BR144) TaxID=431595 RepID=K3WW94_GLOUD